jgi:hypothetical protein
MSNVLEPFEEEVRVRDAIWRTPGKVPRMEARQHRDGSATKVLVRSDTERDGGEVVKVGTTVHFTPEEWQLLTRAVLAGLGLMVAEDDQ